MQRARTILLNRPSAISSTARATDRRKAHRKRGFGKAVHRIHRVAAEADARQAREEFLLAALSPDERAALDKALATLLERAEVKVLDDPEHRIVLVGRAQLGRVLGPVLDHRQRREVLPGSGLGDSEFVGGPCD